MKLQILLPVLLISLPLSSCKTTGGWFGKEEEEPDSPVLQEEMKVPVGKIHMVSPGGDFVLIRSSKFLSVPPETVLTVIGNGGLETARLKVSPARKGAFLTADIVSGAPNVGDHTLMDYVTKVNDPMGDPFGSGDEIQVLE